MMGVADYQCGCGVVEAIAAFLLQCCRDLSVLIKRKGNMVVFFYDT